MTQGERVKEIRKSLEMTMEQFGSRLHRAGMRGRDAPCHG